MEDQEDAAAATNSNQPAICEECKSNPSKYKCPGCAIRSCSLPCVKAHKQRTGCTGKRHRTDFIPISQFDDNLLLSDYNMLEDSKRVAESAQRMREKLCGYSHFRLPSHLQRLRSAAASRRTKLLFHSSGMTKRKTNQSCYNNRKKFICWTIEWRFHSTDIVLIDHRVHENTNLYSVIENHLKPGPWNHRLRQFCEEPLDSLKFFIRKYPKGPRSPFRELDLKSPICQQLADLVILEYPVIYVFLPSHSNNFEVIKDTIPHKPELKESANNNNPSPQGVTFREEIIEDGSCSGPKVLDLMQHVKPNTVFQIPDRDRRAEKEVTDTLDKPLLAKVAQATKPVLKNGVHIHKTEDDHMYSSCKTKEPGFFEDIDFVFEQGLMDVYSDLVEQTNPDEFFDFEDLFTEEVELEGREDHPDFSGLIQVEEELEEGEIPGS
ncbi:uncharacterized protein LOC132299295 [Cornus florida]|uniref:uncharacterized protein LOC132299295 n=1 Tax=Cornus florida TaxID=4283 RepID=UPI00289C674E|nr:uncharacterized protein LOC132299295 [Cornus florida]